MSSEGDKNMAQSPSQGRIEYVVFDMDGLLIDSETIYTRVTNNILAKYGKEMTWDIKKGLMGKPEREAAAHLLSHFPEIDLTVTSYLQQRDAQQDLLWPTVPLMPGAARLVQHLNKHSIPIAVATGSRRRNFEMKTGHLMDACFGAFEGHVVCGDDVIPDAQGGGGTRNLRGKPDPDIFLTAARTQLHRNVGDGDVTGVTDQEVVRERGRGLIIEDAIPGVEAGKRAGMSVVWVPDPNLLDVEYHAKEKPDQVLKSLLDFVPEEWGLPPYNDS